jgi:DNA polymerase-3 subunit epsilon
VTARRLVVVDTETTGLTDKDIIVEIAWWDLGTDERGVFIPQHDVAWVLMNAHPDALAMNGYEQRLANAPQNDGSALTRLHHVLRGQCIGGSNIRYDVAKLSRLFAANRLRPEPWFYHLAELSPYACGVLGLPPTDPPGLSKCCDLLGIPAGDHTAAADVTATGLAFKALMAKAGVTSTEGAAT